MTRMAVMPIYGKKILQKSSRLVPVADFNETWCQASGTPAYHSLFK